MERELGTLISTWTFRVWANEEDGKVATAWRIERHIEPEHKVMGVSEGPLHNAVLDAYDRNNLTCPLVLEPDLLAMSRWEEPE